MDRPPQTAKPGLPKPAFLSDMNTKELSLISHLAALEKENSEASNSLLSTAHSKAIKHQNAIKELNKEISEVKNETLIGLKIENVPIFPSKETSKAKDEIRSSSPNSSDQSKQRPKPVRKPSKLGESLEKSFHTPKKNHDFSENECSVDRKLKAQTRTGISKTLDLPLEMSQFAFDNDPTLYFEQKQALYKSFVKILTKQKEYNESLSICHFNYRHSIFYNSYEIQISSKEKKRTAALPFVVAYFLMSLPTSVQIFFCHELILHFLKNSKKVPHCVQIRDFLAVLKKLEGKEESVRGSLFARRSIQRKSIFKNLAFNQTFDEKEGEEPEKKTIKVKKTSSKLTETDKEPDVPSIKVKKSFSSSSKSEESSSEEDLNIENSFHSRNPFELKYSKVNFEGEQYELRVKKPYAKKINGVEQEMQIGFVFEIVTRFEEIEFC